MNIVFVIANQSSVPYFNWFAEKAAQQKEHQFTFVALDTERPKMIEDVGKFGWKCYWIKFDSRKRKMGMIAAFFALYKLFRQLKPDVVHTHLFDDSLPGLLAARLAGVKKRVVTKQDTTFHYYYAQKWVIADRFNNWNATIIHAVATDNFNFIVEKEKANINKIHLIRNGFPFDKMTNDNPNTIEAIKTKFKLHDKFVIGTFARLIEWKGHLLILEAAKTLVTKYNNLIFIWAGTGDVSYKERLVRKVEEYNLSSNIIFLDWVERSDMPSIYKTLDMYLHPAINEPFGFVISEALMNGIPTAATKTGSSELITHKQDGLILESNSVTSIIESVSFYYENVTTKDIIAKNGLSHSLKYLTFDRMYEEHISMYIK